MKHFKWLHLTDLHVGQMSHEWLWPNFKKVFIDDLEWTYKETGGLDAFIFSGDLTQKGTADEYGALTTILRELYEKFEQWGSVPKFFAVPGNHDLVRPNPEAPESLLLKRWWEESAVSKQFWEDDQSIYRRHVAKAFENYTSWFAGLSSHGIPTFSTTAGILPGDISAVEQFDGLSVGFVGLNSSFLQLDGANYEGKLALDVRQLLALTNNDPGAWFAQNSINFLITHHPATWLSAETNDQFSSEIAPPDRFTAHLYGHMHKASMLNKSIGGGSNRKAVQGPSIFGLEHLADGTTDRIHGYSVGRISVDETGAEWRMWPRKAHVRQDGGREMIPDYDFAIEKGEQYVRESLTIARNSSDKLGTSLVVKPSVELTLATVPEDGRAQQILDQLSYPLRRLEQHLPVRIPAQQACVAAIAIDRMAWVCTDWGLGTDGFLYSVVKALGRDEGPVYRVDLANYATRDDFLAKFHETHRCSFAEFCRVLVKVGPATLLFDEAPSAGTADRPGIALDVEKLGQMVLDFCPQIAVLAITRVRPLDGKLVNVELLPLDEPDTRAYIFSHPESPGDIKNAASVADIFVRTDGIPNKIDRLLKSLRVVSLAELPASSINSRVEGPSLSEGVPLALSNAVGSILESTDSSTQRSALLLKLLCVLPHGETLRKIKRFDPQHVFHHQHAEELLDRALIEVKSGFGVLRKGVSSDFQQRILSVRGTVRDYVCSLLSDREVDTLVRKAMGLYFEQQRSTGQWRLRGREGVGISEDLTTLDNAHGLCLRTLARAVAQGQRGKAKSAVQLTQIYCAELAAGDHYRACAMACDSILKVIRELGDHFEEEEASLKYILARCLRMLGETERALELIEELRLREWPKDLKLMLLLNHALCLKSLGDVDAIDIAKEVIRLSPRSDSALHARAIVIEMSAQGNERQALLKLEGDAKKRGANTVRNNLILSRADLDPENGDILAALSDVLQSSLKNGDPYNASRAAVKIATIVLSRKGRIRGDDLNRLIAAYQYFYGQRFDNLFLATHKALWQVFEQAGDVQNLLSLFKYSSFIWRLGGKEERETPYIQKLGQGSSHILSADLRTADQDTAYFVTRARRIKDPTQLGG